MRRSTAARGALGVAGALALTVLAAPGVAGDAGRGRFGLPVKVTPALAGGYEPTVVTDRFGNLFATAHKENTQLVVSPDGRSTTGTRSMSWGWISADNGATWQNLPGLPAQAEDKQPGIEGDMAVDDAGHMYFVDMYLGDNTITRYTATGRGKVSLDFTRPLMGTGTIDDRPWVTAHGNGIVFYLGNSGNKLAYPLGQTAGGSANGPGRYTVHTSYDGGKTFDPTGYTLNDSGWCRPAAEHRKGSKRVVVLCTDDQGTLYSYVSNDDARTWQRYRAGSYRSADDTQSYPTVEWAADGSLWGLYVDAGELSSGFPITNRLILLRSVNGGRTWTSRDITPREGRYQHAWLSVAPDGKTLGLGVYHRPDTAEPWHVYGATWKVGEKPRLALLDSTPVARASSAEAPGDFLTSSFGPDGKLAVMWTRAGGSLRDIYTARQR